MLETEIKYRIRCHTCRVATVADDNKTRLIQESKGLGWISDESQSLWLCPYCADKIPKKA